MQGITHGEGGGTMFEGDALPMLRLTMMLQCLGMEMRGIRMVRHSVYAQVKRELGFKGNKQAVYDQLAEHVRRELAARGADQADVKALASVGSL